ncbi:hypothetical protein C8Q70DRAFT_993925 [Cubamyces menziesii]|nr:hypothetical protein C8Q70DRAFT_993925 [Cubamyces menziesii]
MSTMTTIGSSSPMAGVSLGPYSRRMTTPCTPSQTSTGAQRLPFISQVISNQSKAQCERCQAYSHIFNTSLLGTAVAVYGAVGDVAHNGWPSTSYAVDGVVYETYDFVTASGYSDATQFRYQVPYFTLQDLPAVDHILVITNLNGTAPNTYWLDYIRFLPFSGSSASANPGSTSSPILTSTPSSTPVVTAPAITLGDDSAGDSRREGAVVGGTIGGGIILVVFLAISATYLYMRQRRYGSSSRPLDLTA